MTAAIEVRNLAVGYDGIAILEGLNFDVPAQSVTVIIGGSGAGKTTVLQNLIGLETPISGSIEFKIETPSDGSPPFGVMFQSGALFGSKDLLDNVSLPLQKWTRLPPEAIEVIARARLRLVGLGGFEHHLPAEISGGMVKRAAIARALALEPPLVFLDEPSSGLDPITASEIDDLILMLSRDLGVTFVIITHELQSIFKIGALCVMVDREAGGIIASGPPHELQHSDVPKVRAFFNRESMATQPGPK